MFVISQTINHFSGFTKISFIHFVQAEEFVKNILSELHIMFPAKSGISIKRECCPSVIFCIV
jgi:hypothetical protein